MGILNVTPDSFADGGKYYAEDQAIKQGRKMIAEGADIIDIGGESTRPNATPIDPDIEANRVLSVIEALRDLKAPISIDSRNPEVIGRALAAGASIVNDVTALSNPESLAIAARHQAPVVLMHMQGTPQTMQQFPEYKNVVREICDYLLARADACLNAGIPKSHIVIDPGIGFGKSTEHNIEILQNLQAFKRLGFPLLIGASRKSFIARLSQDEAAQDRLPGSIAAAIHCAAEGADILRVHDVKETAQALAIGRALN